MKYRVRQKVVFKGQPELGVWTISHFTTPGKACLTPTEQSHPGLAKLTDRATIEVDTATLTPHILTGEIIHGLPGSTTRQA